MNPSTTLLIDIGNSRIKWLNQPTHEMMRNVNVASSLNHHQSDWSTLFLDAMTQTTKPHVCYISSVASKNILDQIKAILFKLFGDLDVQVIVPQKMMGRFKLGYDVPMQMGPDRFAQLIGAQAICPERNHLVISAGTATTIDGVLATGEHIGGAILPSIHLMRTSLHHYTERLPLEGGEMSHTHAPHSTLDALATGARLANSGAISMFAQTYMPAAPMTWVVCGGAAEVLANDLSAIAAQFEATIISAPALCLLGLEQIRLFQQSGISEF